jgi:chromosome segregation ATPase
MNNFKTVLNIFLIVIALAACAFSAVLFRQKAELSQQLKEKQFQIDVEEEENQKLTAENESLKRDLDARKELQENFAQIKTELEDKLKTSEEKTSTLEADLKDVQWKLEQLKNENNALTKEIESLKAQAKADARKVQPQPATTPTKAEAAPPKAKKFIFF